MAKSALGSAIKQTRQALGKTALQLAQELPADHTTIFRYEAQGNVRPDTMVRITEVLKEPKLLLQYCKQCPVGRARNNFNLKRAQKRKNPQAGNQGIFKKLLQLF